MGVGLQWWEGGESAQYCTYCVVLYGTLTTHRGEGVREATPHIKPRADGYSKPLHPPGRRWEGSWLFHSRHFLAPSQNEHSLINKPATRISVLLTIRPALNGKLLRIRLVPWDGKGPSLAVLPH